MMKTWGCLDPESSLVEYIPVPLQHKRSFEIKLAQTKMWALGELVHNHCSQRSSSLAGKINNFSATVITLQTFVQHYSLQRSFSQFQFPRKCYRTNWAY